MPTALVTGGAGFIGSHLVQHLVDRGWSVRVLDNLSTGTRENLAGTGAELAVGDIRDPKAVDDAVRGAEVVFHLAAMISVPESMTQPAECYRSNVLGSLHVLDAARREGARRVVLSSSCAVYGDTNHPVDEASETAPISPYAASKLSMEQAAKMMAAAFGLETVCLRYFNVYGPRQAPDSPYAAAIPTFIATMMEGRPPVIHGDGQQTRDFVFVGDVARANLLAAEAQVEPGAVFNIGCGRSVSIQELVASLRALLPGIPEPTYGPPRPGDIRLSAGRIDRAGQALGYRPETALKDGLAATVEWARGAAR
jgi:nucleoside-diphosphate-sugar epimerase